jgi:hypothetical protein
MTAKKRRESSFLRSLPKGGTILYRSQSIDRTSSKNAAGSGRLPRLNRRWAYRIYHQNGFLTLERYRVTSRVFFSFSGRDYWRVTQVRRLRRGGDSGETFQARRWQIGRSKSQTGGDEDWGSRASKLEPDSEWERIVAGGSEAIRQWIDGQMKRKAGVVVLIGTHTAGKDWVRYEIEKGWNDRKGVVGVYIHNLQDNKKAQTTKGRNPFDELIVGKRSMSDIVKAYDPPFQDSREVLGYIRAHLGLWVEEAVDIRSSNRARAQIRSNPPALDT